MGGQRHPSLPHRLKPQPGSARIAADFGERLRVGREVDQASSGGTIRSSDCGVTAAA